MLVPHRHAVSLRERFEDTREEQARNAFITAVARSPDTTMEELAREVAKHPELGDITLEQLLARVRRLRAQPATRGAATLVAALTSRGPQVRGFVVHAARGELPKLAISSEAQSRIGRDVDALAEVVLDLLGAARRLEAAISMISIYAESLGERDVAVDVRIDDVAKREAMWAGVERMAPRLPPWLWIGLM